VGSWLPDADQQYLIALRQELAGRGVRCELEDRGPWPRLRIYCPDESPTAEFDNNVIAAPLHGQWWFCWPAAVPIGPIGSLAQAAADIIDELGLGDAPVQAVASLPAWRMLRLLPPAPPGTLSSAPSANSGLRRSPAARRGTGADPGSGCG
jgi:hypothetical protein